MPITSPHNEALKEVRKLAGRRWRDKLGEFVAEGEDLLAAADAASWQPLARYVAAESGLGGIEVAPHVLAQVSQLGSGTRALAGDPPRWRGAAGRGARGLGRARPHPDRRRRLAQRGHGRHRGPLRARE